MGELVYYQLSINGLVPPGDEKYGFVFNNKCMFSGTRLFFPHVESHVLFFKSPEQVAVCWWHGWLNTVFVQGSLKDVGTVADNFKEGMVLDLIKYDDDRYISKEFMIDDVFYPALKWHESYISFNFESIDIGGERLILW